MISVIVFVVMLFIVNPNSIDIGPLKTVAEYLPLILVLNVFLTAVIAAIYVSKVSYFKTSEKILFIATLLIFGLFSSVFLFFYTKSKEQELIK